jgi:hypothetical protein
MPNLSSVITREAVDPSGAFYCEDTGTVVDDIVGRLLVFLEISCQDLAL